MEHKVLNQTVEDGVDVVAVVDVIHEVLDGYRRRLREEFHGDVAGTRFKDHDIVGRVTDQRVVALAPAQRIVARTADDEVPSGVALQYVIAVVAMKRIAAALAVDHVVTGTALKRVGLGTAKQRVISIMAIERVGTKVAFQIVIAKTALNGIGGAPADQLIIPFAADERRCPRERARIQHVRSRAARQLHRGDSRKDIVAQTGQTGVSESETRVGFFDQDSTASAAIQRVVAGSARD